MELCALIDCGQQRQKGNKQDTSTSACQERRISFFSSQKEEKYGSLTRLKLIQAYSNFSESYAPVIITYVILYGLVLKLELPC